MLTGLAWLVFSPGCQNQASAAGRCLFPSVPPDTLGLCTPRNCFFLEQPGIYKHVMGKWQICGSCPGTGVEPSSKLSWWSSLPDRRRGRTVSCRRPGWCGRCSRHGGSPQAAGGGRWGRSAGASQGGLRGSEEHLHQSPNRIQSHFSFSFLSRQPCVKKLTEVRLLVSAAV